ncbi:MAG: hypothetical protein ACOC9Q_02090, partial [bacterium]
MAKAIVHIGAGKCGSSAIQASLSAVPQLANRTGTEFRYVVADANFRMLPVCEIVKRATLSRSGYVKSPNPRRLCDMTGEVWSTLCASLEADIAAGRILVLSSEDYFMASELFAEAHLFDRLGASATILAYVRPQVDYLNSAWWQWGAWTGERFDRWLAKRLGRAAWARHIVRWKDVPGVQDIIIRPLPKDVVSDFYECVLNAQAPLEVRRR